MAEIRVEQNLLQEQQKPAVDVVQPRVRLNLHTTNRFENNRKTFAGIGKQDLSAAANKDGAEQAPKKQTPSVVPERFRMHDGTWLEIPRLPQEQRDQAEAILSRLPSQQQESARQAARKLAKAVFFELQGNPQLASSSSALGAESYTDDLNAAGAESFQLFESFGLTEHDIFANAGVDQTYEESVTSDILLGVTGIEGELYDFFDNIRQEQNLSEDVRTDAVELEQMLAEWPDDGSTEVFEYNDVVFNDDGSTTVYTRQIELSKPQAQALLNKLNGDIESLASISMRSHFALQMIVQKYQQAQNVVSNIMKLQHETHRGIVQNVRA